MRKAGAVGEVTSFKPCKDSTHLARTQSGRELLSLSSASSGIAAVVQLIDFSASSEFPRTDSKVDFTRILTHFSCSHMDCKRIGTLFSTY